MTSFLLRLIRTLPCLAAFMSSLTIMTIAVDRFRFIVRQHKSQVIKWRIGESRFENAIL